MTALPAFIDRDAWQGYADMRKAMKKPMTPRAETLVLKTLYQLHNRGHDANAALDQSTVHNWIDVYEPKPKEIANLKREYMTSVDSGMTDAERVASKEAKERAMAALRGNLRRVA